jgi:hypothetical protein
MFKPNSKVSYNKRNYYVVLDHIIVNDELVDDESQFVSSKQKITDDLEISFINHYNIIEQNNPVGFWQSVLSNHSFDYSNNFKCQIKIDDSESHFISFDVNKGIKIHTDANLIDLNQFNLIQIDFDGFTNFEIIKTQQQIKQDKNQLYRNLLLKHLPVYAVIFGSIFAYYQYEKNIFVQRNERLLSLKAEAFDLQSNIERIVFFY